MPAEPHSTYWIEELLKNNNLPSDETVRKTKELLTIPLKELEYLDAKILDLKNRLSELESKRDETQKQISQYRSILAPIRRIPPDVLGEIFLHCLPTHRNPIIKSTECPLLLTRICNPWRAVAMSSPRLWERIYITFTDDDTVPDLESAAEMVRKGRITSSEWQDAQPKLEKEHTIAVLRRRYEAVKQWLSRSGSRPLSISLSFSSTHWYSVPYSKRPPGVMMELLSFLATLAPRWRHLELKILPEIYEVLEQMILASPSEMAALTSLKIKYPPYFSVTHRQRSVYPVLFHAPHLQKVFIATSGNTRKAIDPSIRWNQLTSISCFDLLTFAQTVDLLQLSSNLVHYKGAISNHAGDAPGTLLHEGYISLPSLQSLSITHYANTEAVGNMYGCIDAPSLKSFNYALRSRGMNATGTAAANSVDCILPLLRASTELQKLTIDMDQTIAGNITTLLYAAPTVIHLVLGSPERHINGSPRASSQFPITGYSQSGHPLAEKDTWCIGNLIVHEDSKDDEPPLLPRLTSLVIFSPNAPISDETLLDLLKSRLVSGRTAALEQVRLVSHRARERDIEGELAAYANLVSGKITLDLNYAQPPAPRTKPISPEYGLKEFAGNGWSWRYTDAEEYDDDM